MGVLQLQPCSCVGVADACLGSLSAWPWLSLYVRATSSSGHGCSLLGVRTADHIVLLCCFRGALMPVKCHRMVGSTVIHNLAKQVGSWYLGELNWPSVLWPLVLLVRPTSPCQTMSLSSDAASTNPQVLLWVGLNSQLQQRPGQAVLCGPPVSCESHLVARLCIARGCRVHGLRRADWRHALFRCGSCLFYMCKSKTRQDKTRQDKKIATIPASLADQMFDPSSGPTVCTFSCLHISLGNLQ